MEQLTVRGFDPELAQALKDLSRREGLSLSQAAVRLMREGAGLNTKGRKLVGNRLDRFIGTMTQEEEEELFETLRPCQQVDESFWT